MTSSLDSLSCCIGLFVCFLASCLAESWARSWFRNMAGCMIQKALDRRQAAWWTTRSLCNRRALASVIMIHMVHGFYWPLVCCITGWFHHPLHQCGQTFSYMYMQALGAAPCCQSSFFFKLMERLFSVCTIVQTRASHPKKEKSLRLLKCDLKQTTDGTKNKSM